MKNTLFMKSTKDTSPIQNTRRDSTIFKNTVPNGNEQQVKSTSSLNSIVFIIVSGTSSKNDRATTMNGNVSVHVD